MPEATTLTPNETEAAKKAGFAPVKKERRFREIKSDFVKMGVDDTIEGAMVKKDSITFPPKGANPATVVGKYTIRADDGNEFSFLGGTKIDQLLDDLQLGTYVRITRVADVLTASRMKMKDYRLEVAES